MCITKCFDLFRKEKAATAELQPVPRYLRIKKKLTQLLKKQSRENADEKRCVIANLSEKVAEYQQKMPLNKQDSELYMISKAELEELLLEKANAAMFRCKAKWAVEGEKCSKYFLNLEKNRYAARVCHTILNDGREITDASEILNEQASFYRQLYKTNSDVKFSMEKL